VATRADRDLFVPKSAAVVAALALSILSATACGESVRGTPHGDEAGAGSAGTSASGAGGGPGSSAGSAPGGAAGTNPTAGTSGSSSSFGGGTFEETHAPAVPHVGTDDETGEGLYRVHNPNLEITHSHLLLEEAVWLGTVKNVGAETLCQAFMELRFLLENGVVARAIGALYGRLRDTPDSGSPAYSCIESGESADAEAILLTVLPLTSVISEVRYAITPSAEIGEPRSWFTIEDGTWRESDAGGRTFGGRIVVGEWPIRKASVWVIPKTAAGLPLSILATSDDIAGAMPPGHTLDFVTEPFDGAVAGYTVNLGAIGE
jgi:hypothetical protein